MKNMILTMALMILFTMLSTFQIQANTKIIKNFQNEEAGGNIKITLETNK